MATSLSYHIRQVAAGVAKLAG